jgi:acyl-CoA synthetase (NDP forming)
MARARGLRLVGPNCMGVYSAPARLNGTYFWDLPRGGTAEAPAGARGGIGIVSQSGAYGGLIFRHLAGRGLRVARFLSIGNQADVDVAEVIEYLVDDPATALIACFIEALGDGARFLAAARRAVGRKPLVVLKGGRSEAGRRAAGSHTGSLAGSYEIFRAACRSTRAVLAEETEEFFDAIETLALAGERRPGGPRVAIVTVSGGPSVMAADVAERDGLAVPALDAETCEALRGLLPPFAAVGNPVDLTPQVEPARIEAAVGCVLAHPEVAGAVAVNVGLDIPEFGDALVHAAGATGKPVVAFIADAPEITARLMAGGIPVLPSPERAVRAWRALWAARSAMPVAVIRPRTLPDDVAAAIQNGHGPLPYGVARRALEAYGVRFCREKTVAGGEEAVAAAEDLGYPVVVKGDAPGMLHKTEAGAVILDLRDAHAVREACRAMAARSGVTRFVVQERVGPGVELLAGGQRDSVFGPVVAVGTGGILTEVVRDVSWRLAPLGAGEAGEMLREGLRPRLLAGPRGLAAVEEGALVEVLEGLSTLLVDHPRILELDINPVIAVGADVVAVDAVMIVGASS